MIREEKYSKYINMFKNLDIEEKREFIISNLQELLELFHKINLDFSKNSKLFITENNCDTENEFLDTIFDLIISLKEASSNALELVLDNFYEID